MLKFRPLETRPYQSVFEERLVHSSTIVCMVLLRMVDSSATAHVSKLTPRAAHYVAETKTVHRARRAHKTSASVLHVCTHLSCCLNQRNSHHVNLRPYAGDRWCFAHSKQHSATVCTIHGPHLFVRVGVVNCFAHANERYTVVCIIELSTRSGGAAGIEMHVEVSASESRRDVTQQLPVTCNEKVFSQRWLFTSCLDTAFRECANNC